MDSLLDLDLTTQLIIGLAIYIFFPQLWPALKNLFPKLKLDNPAVEPLKKIDDDQIDDSSRLLTWLSLFEQCAELKDEKLEKTLLTLPSMLVEKKEETNV